MTKMKALVERVRDLAIYQAFSDDWEKQQDFRFLARAVVYPDGRMVRVSAKEWERLVREGLL